MAHSTTETTMDTATLKDTCNGTNGTKGAIPAKDKSQGQDHPEGDAIRRQVEYYFSDENLPTDVHLLQLCGGRENLPIRLGNICCFKKMRQYKPRSLVVAALRKSDFLEISADGKTIKRKVPLQEKCMLDKDFYEDDEIAYDPRTKRPLVLPILQAAQQKPENPLGLSKNMLKPTGFERTYIEPPQTPAEAIEENALYDPEKSFVERIEIAIQRFKQRRRMHQMYAEVFNKFMRFGGVDCGPRMYQGVTTQELADMDVEERVRALATHQVPWDRANSERWSVDFVGVGKAFLSSWWPAQYGHAENKIKNACGVLRSFYKYLLYHRVCPEYQDHLIIARDMCDTAEMELLKTEAAGLMLPGDFNRSASVIFGGEHANLYTGDKAWAIELREEGLDGGEVGLSDAESRVRFDTGVAIMGSAKQFEKLTTTGFDIAREESVCLEVTAIHAPEDRVRNDYAEHSKTMQHKLGQLAPLGKLVCASWYPEDCEEWDLPQDNDKYPNGQPGKPMEGKEYTFWVEEDVLEKCFVGMKMDAKVLILDDGPMVLDNVNNVMCSFYTWLPNELWMERKPKEVRWRGTDADVEVDAENKAEVDGNEQEAKNASEDEFDDE